jgi:hypothetical protein
VGQRLFAVVVVIASACTALQFSSTEQESVTISFNPHHFSGSGTQIFTISPANGFDHDILQSISMMCSSQWSLNTGIDPQQPVLGANVCGSGSGSGSQMQVLIDQSDQSALPCPRNYQFSVSFSGTQPGVSSCNVVVTTVGFFGGSNYEMKTLSLSGSGSSVTGITVEPKTVTFGQIPQTVTSSEEKVTVTNLGSATITVAGTLTGAGFSVDQSFASFQLGSGASTTFDVRCTPPGLGDYAGNLSFTAGSSSGSASLSCEGIISTISLNPSSVRFADTLVGRPPLPESIRITGNGPAMIESVTLDSTATAAGVTIASNPQGMAIGSGQDVVLTYSADAIHEAVPLGKLSIKVSTDTAARDVAISGEALLGDVGTNPASVNFGAVCAGSKTMKDVEVYASEPGDIVLQAMTKPAAPFDATLMDSVPKTLGGNHTGANMMVRATFEPTAPGDFKDALALATNVPNKPTTEVEVHGISLAAGIAATPEDVHFGVVPVKTTTSIQEVQFTNCGSGDLQFTRAYITGPNALEFTLIGTHPAKTLKPTESETFMVVMQPDSNGVKTAKLMIEHDQGTTTADLDGTAEGGSLTERETYYACSTGRSAALWPLALALLALRRRRRR